MPARKTAAERTYSYRDFRAVAELSKKEADGWVQKGVIRSELPPGRRRRVYTFESLMEGSIAKQLADFASRELLPKMMDALRRCLKENKIDLDRVPPDPGIPRLLIQIYTRISREQMPGGGIRGVVAYAKRYEPKAAVISKSVFLVVDLNLIALEVYQSVDRLN